MPKESILAHLAPLLTNQIENVATDALAHLIIQYSFLADAFRVYILSTGVDFPNNLDFKTQGWWQDAAIPDLVGRDEEGRYLLIIESKFWAPLTTHQPNTYINRLPSDRPALLLFIAPASRLQTLWPELISRCDSSAISKKEPGETVSTQFKTINLVSKHVLALTSWESLLDAFHARSIQEKDEYAAGDIWQLQSLCTKIDAEAFKPLSEEDIYSPTQKRINQFRDVINDLVMRLVDSGVIKITGYSATSGPGYYKRYMTIQTMVNWCIEFNEQYRRNYPPTSLWLTRSVKQTQKENLSKLFPVSHQVGNQFIIPLQITSDVERETILESLFSQVCEISKKLINL